MKRHASPTASERSTKSKGFSSMTRPIFEEIYCEILDHEALKKLYSFSEWKVSQLATDLVILTLKDHLLAFDYVLQPGNVEAPSYLQVWEILKNLLALQTGGGARVCVAVEDEPHASDDEPDANTVLGYEAALTGGAVKGKSEFVLVRAPGTLDLPIRRGLDLVGVEDGITPLLVGEVKAKEGFEQDIWQPLSCALELMKKSPSQPQSMWVFLTDLLRWDFVCVERLPYSSGTAGGTTAAGGATAGATTVTGTAKAGGAAAASAGGAAAGAAAAGAAPASTAAARVKYTFNRFETVSIAPMEIPSEGYLKLLAVLYHIIYPREQLENLPARIGRSSEALQARAQAWVNDAEKKQKRIDEELAAAKKAQAEAEAKAAEAEARAKAEAEARAKAEADARAAEADARAANERVQQLLVAMAAQSAGRAGGGQGSGD